MKRLHGTQLLSVPRTLGNGVHFPVMNNAVSDSLAERAVAQSCVQPGANVGWGGVRKGYVHVDGDAGSSRGELQLAAARVASLASPGWFPERGHFYYGNNLFIKIGAAEVVKGAQGFPFGLSWIHLVEGLGFQAGGVQAEPPPARREAWEDHSG